ncbi:MAG TPA: pantoate--beta-alanine ligase [Nitrospiraceae bacterium]|nr:pantoate--beta-alanine ligase [Nitrospiraceae bacterium]
MNVVTTIADMRTLAESHRKKGRTIGFVPTMGFLHEGHLSLMREARKSCDIVVVSIFVNPTQFGPGEDFDRYPRDEKGDREKCEAEGIDVLFIPSAAEMYPPGDSVSVPVEGIADILEGASRPGHFRGVATVVARLFTIVGPHKAFFGQKDFQQTVVIERMATGLNMDVKIVVLPTVREQDGLAMSSRNSYLRADERRAAASLYRALSEGEGLIRSGVGAASKLKRAMRAVLEKEAGIEIDYLEIVDPESLVSLREIEHRAVLLVAARIGRTRLIDNVLIL